MFTLDREYKKSAGSLRTQRVLQAENASVNVARYAGNPDKTVEVLLYTVDAPSLDRYTLRMSVAEAERLAATLQRVLSASAPSDIFVSAPVA